MNLTPVLEASDNVRAAEREASRLRAEADRIEADARNALQEQITFAAGGDALASATVIVHGNAPPNGHDGAGDEGEVDAERALILRILAGTPDGCEIPALALQVYSNRRGGTQSKVRKILAALKSEGKAKRKPGRARFGWG